MTQPRRSRQHLLTDDRARRAVSAFRKLQPTLTAYARNLTGRSDVQVVMSASSPYTDGKKIYFKPPIRLGDADAMRHTRSLCDRRDPDTLLQLCDACATREYVLSLVYHEISHIAFDSFMPVVPMDVKAALRMIEQIAPAWQYERIKESFAKRSDLTSGFKGYNQLASGVSPYMAMLLNALEDVRINERMADARPGTRLMQQASMRQTAINGVEQADRSILHWNEYDPNQQVALAAMCRAAGYTIGEDWFVPQVMRVLNDKPLVDLLVEVPHLPGVQATFVHTFKVFLRLRKLGFFVTTDEEPPPIPAPSEEDESAQEDPVSAEDVAPSNEPDAGSDDNSEPGSSEDDGDDSEPGGDDPGGDDSGRKDGGDEGDAAFDTESAVEADDADGGSAGDPGSDAADSGGGDPGEDGTPGEGADGTSDPSAEGDGDSASGDARGGTPADQDDDASAEGSDSGVEDASSDDDPAGSADGATGRDSESDEGDAGSSPAASDGGADDLGSGTSGGPGDAGDKPSTDDVASDNSGQELPGEAGDASSGGAPGLDERGDEPDAADDRDGSPAGGSSVPDLDGHDSAREGPESDDDAGSSEPQLGHGDLDPDRSRGDDAEAGVGGRQHGSGGGGTSADGRGDDDAGVSANEGSEAGDEDSADDAANQSPQQRDGDRPERDNSTGQDAPRKEDGESGNRGADGEAGNVEGGSEEARSGSSEHGAADGSTEASEGSFPDSPFDEGGRVVPSHGEAEERSATDEGADRGGSDGDGPEEEEGELGSGVDVDAEDLGHDPLDYRPDADSAVSAPEGEYQMVPPTIGSDDEIDLVDLGLHPDIDTKADQRKSMEKAVESAIVQSVYFEKPSERIFGLKVWKYEDREADVVNRPWHAWGGNLYGGGYASLRGQRIDPVGEAVLGPALMRMRLVFSDNKRTKHNRNQRSGRIDTRTLGKRAWSGDDRLFGQKVVPNKKDYFVALFLDVSGSTRGVNLKMIKEAALAQAELCHRMGIKFAVYAHTGSPSEVPADNESWDIWVDLYEVKAPDQGWDDKCREALMSLNPSAANLDGHTLEFARKLLDTRTETNRVILYYSDGAMPLENHDEELEILQREIKTCRAKGYTLAGVGVRTDSPSRHGMDTVQIDDSAEVGKVVTHLERHIIP